MNFNLPGSGPELGTAIERLLRQTFSFPIRLWREATADLPSASEENKAAVYWNETESLIGYSDGTAHHTLAPSDNPEFTGAITTPVVYGPGDTLILGLQGNEARITLDDSLATASAVFNNMGITGDTDYPMRWAGDIHIISSDEYTSFAIDHEGAYDTVNSGGRIILSQSGAVPSAANQVVGHIDFMGKYDGGGDNPTPGYIRGVAAGAWTTSSTPFDFVFLTCSSGSLTATEHFRITGTGVEVTGEARCDTLRIDATPTAETPTPTHTVPININGTVYRFPCVV